MQHLISPHLAGSTMFEDSSGLRELFDTKTAQLKSKALYDCDFPYSGVIPTVNSTFLGPILWEDTLPISDLDTINLEEFSPELLERSASVAGTVGHSYIQNNEALGKAVDLDPLTQPLVNLTWTGTPPNPSPTTNDVATENGPPPTRKKSSVPVDQRNEKYWSRRMKNNASAKRSRDARRMLENQVHMKATALERENEQLRLQMTLLVEENKKLRDLLHQANIHLPPSSVVYPPLPASTVARENLSPYSPILPERPVFVPSVSLQDPTSCQSPSFCWNPVRNDCC
ncbi:Hepatic leukemia factor [Clonorchis sinensis]|uniref:Hepatic leukemia factor n=1 Tax=Clonorchis sinensis TaxID=79923 RepID=A0A8T1MMG1_CLOSI|nr:Hepatic leukemia factor [Clonorchis sinensis]